MSRIGKLPITIPSGVTIDIQNNMITVKGPKGELQQTFEPEVKFTTQDDKVHVEIAEKSKRSAAMWGLYRALLYNMVLGVTEGYTKHLEMSGVGYRAAMQGSNLQLSVGFSHPVIMTPPDGVTFAASENTKIAVSGIDKQKVGEAAAKIRAIRPPEPYKGKGIKYAGERIRRKAGKAAKAVGGK